MNTVLANADALGRHPSSMFDVLYLENEAGYIVENLSPTAQGYYYAWDEKTNKILYIMDDLQTVYFPEEYTLDPSVCWITAGSAEEMVKLSEKGYNIAVECDIDEPVVLKNVVSINTLGFTISDITLNSGNIVVEQVDLIGSFGNVSVSAGATNVVQSGVANSVNVTAGSGNITLGGFVSNYSAASGVSSTVSSTGMVSTVKSGADTTIINHGVVKDQGSSNISGNAAGAAANQGNVVTVSNKEGLENVRAQVASGLRTFKGETITLADNVDLKGIAFSPISSFYRKNGEDLKKVWDPETETYVTPKSAENWFAGTFDGNGKTIKGFANNGFSLTGITAGANNSSVSFGATKITYNEAIYGIFASVYNATIKNLNVECDIDMTLDSQNKMVGDSVGGIVGFASGDYLVLENCNVSGSVRGYDGVGGLVGRSYAATTTIKNCTNHANVTAARSAGGIIGYASAYKVEFENVVNNGKVENLGYKYDRDILGANDTGTHNGSGYYRAAAAFCGTNYKGTKVNFRTESIDGFTNNGQVIIAGKTCNYTTLDSDSTFTDVAGY